MAQLTNISINTTGYLQFDTGTVWDRPGSPVIGQVRFNTTYLTLEIYTGSKWQDTKSNVNKTGQSAHTAFSDLGELAGTVNGVAATGSHTLYTDFYGRYGYVNQYNIGSPETVRVNFDGAEARYETTITTTTADNFNQTVGGECVSLAGGRGGCSEGTTDGSINSAGAQTEDYTWYGALRACIRAGMRLCTLTEINEDAARGSGCGHDANAIWTSTPSGNGDGQFYLQVGAVNSYGNYATTADPLDPAGASAGFPDARIGIRCCAPYSAGSSSQYWSIPGE